jgi:hypothetical protein
MDENELIKTISCACGDIAQTYGGDIFFHEFSLQELEYKII